MWYYGDERVVMGDKASFDSGQGITSILVRLIKKRLEQEIDWFIRDHPGDGWRKLAALINERELAGLQRPLPWHFDGFQDDITSITVSEIGQLLDRRIPEIMNDYGLDLSDKPAAAQPHGAAWDSIGASYKATQAGVDVRPRAVVQSKFEREASRILCADVVVEAELRPFAGLMNFVQRFDNTAAAGSVYRLAAAARARDTPLRVGEGAFRRDVKALLDTLSSNGVVAPAVDNPVFYAPPQHGCHGDASGRWGFGVVVNGCCCFGPWPQGLFAKLEAYVAEAGPGGVSISPLELVTSALVVWVAKYVNAPTRIIVNNDNESSGVVTARGIQGGVVRAYVQSGQLEYACCFIGYALGPSGGPNTFPTRVEGRQWQGCARVCFKLREG